MHKQKSNLATVREYGRIYINAHANLKNAIKDRNLVTILDCYGKVHEINRRALHETGLKAKECAGFVIPAQYEGVCV